MPDPTDPDPRPPPDIGLRLRRLRERHGLSQRALARRAGVSNATVSAIEQNRASPSVGKLKRVLDGIPVSLSAFFADEHEAEPPVFFGAGELTDIVSGPVSYRQVGGDLTGKALQMLAERYLPGSDTGETLLSHDGEEVGIVIAGRIEVTVGDRRRVLGPGDAYHFPSRLPHRFRQVGDAPAELISACTPPSF